MDQELIAYLDKRFDKVDKRFAELEGAIRGNGVEIEGLRGDIKQVSEGVVACNQRIDAFQVEVNERFDEMGKLFHKSHSNLHSRVSALEARRAKKVERRT